MIRAPWPCSDIVQGRRRLFSFRGRVNDGAYVDHDQVWLADGYRETAVCRLTEIPLRGQHNVFNVLAAVILADSVGVPIEAMRQAVKSFAGVEHRLELVGTIGGVQYINDSIATAPERAIAALDSFSGTVGAAGWRPDKDMVWDTWAKVVNQRVKTVVLFGELADFLAKKLNDTITIGDRPKIVQATTLNEAVAAAAGLARAGDIVLLAPGGTSYDAFIDFAERGERFRNLVYGLKQESEVRVS